MSFSRMLRRSVIGGLGFSVAVAASPIIGALGLGMVAAGERVLEGDASGLGALAVAAVRGGVLVPVLVGIVWPAWLVAIMIGEWAAVRSLVVHLVVATAISVVGLLGAMSIVGLAEVRVFAVVGIVSGFLHWLVAGRTAGVRDPAPLAGAPRPPHDGVR